MKTLSIERSHSTLPIYKVRMEYKGEVILAIVRWFEQYEQFCWSGGHWGINSFGESFSEEEEREIVEYITKRYKLQMAMFG